MNKSRKSKKAFIVAAIALMAALVVGMGAMTYSKYITTSSTETTATAAKWGFVIAANADDLFGANYTKNGDYAIKVNGNEDGVAVKASGLTLAPGTSGSMTFNVNGTAEVLAKLTFEVSAASLIGIDYTSAEDYYPIKWTLKKGDQVVVDNKDFDTLKSKVSEQSSNIAIGQSLEDTYTLSWVWALDGNDAKDTLIGQHAAENDTTVDGGTISSTLKFTLSIKVEQVQE